MNELAPIVLFGFNRPVHLKRCLESLYKNRLASQSSLFVFVDNIPLDSNEDIKNKNQAVIEIARSKQWCGNVNVIIRPTNFGIERNIIEGVSEVLKINGRIIVIEDDLEVSEVFLDFMNAGLEKYENEDSVKQVAGYNFINTHNSCFFLPFTNSWGWGTWSRVWNEINFTPNEIVLSPLQKYLFDVEGTYSYSNMLAEQFYNHQKYTWDIVFWHYVFIAKGVVLYPQQSLVLNTGFDGSGVHYTKKIDASSQSVGQIFDESRLPLSVVFKKESIQSLKNILLEFNQPLLGIIKNRIIYILRKSMYLRQTLYRYYYNS